MDAPKRGDSICTYKSYGYALFTYNIHGMHYVVFKCQTKYEKYQDLYFWKVIAQLWKPKICSKNSSFSKYCPHSGPTLQKKLHIPIYIFQNMFFREKFGFTKIESQTSGFTL